MGDIIAFYPKPKVDLICPFEIFEMDKEYTCDQPLHIGNVEFSSKHFLGTGPGKPHKMRHPNFLREQITKAGMSQGKVINIIEQEVENIIVFACETQFYNHTTKKNETVRYRAACKFSDQIREGVRVMVKEVMREAGV